MNKSPLNYSTKDIEDIMSTPISIIVRLSNENKITESYEGEIINYSLDANGITPYGITFKTVQGKIKKYNFFEIKEIIIK